MRRPEKGRARPLLFGARGELIDVWFTPKGIVWKFEILEAGLVTGVHFPYHRTCILDAPEHVTSTMDLLIEQEVTWDPDTNPAGRLASDTVAGLERDRGR